MRQPLQPIPGPLRPLPTEGSEHHLGGRVQRCELANDRASGRLRNAGIADHADGAVDIERKDERDVADAVVPGQEFVQGGLGCRGCATVPGQFET